MATQDVFAHLTPGEDDDPMIGIQFLELRGDKCFDLLANTKGAWYLSAAFVVPTLYRYKMI